MPYHHGAWCIFFNVGFYVGLMPSLDAKLLFLKGVAITGPPPPNT